MFHSLRYNNVLKCSFSFGKHTLRIRFFKLFSDVLLLETKVYTTHPVDGLKMAHIFRHKLRRGRNLRINPQEGRKMGCWRP